MSAKPVRGASTPGIDRLHAGIHQVLDHHHRVVALLQRLGVEEGGQARQRLGVVVHRDGDVLLVGAELVGDLVVEAFDEGSGRHGADATGWLQERPRDGAPGAPQRTLHTHAHLSRHRWRRVPGVPSVRRAPAPRPPGHLRRQPRDGVAGEHRAHPRARVSLRARRHHRAVLHRRARGHRLPRGVARLADRLPAPAAAHAQGRLARHPPHARAGQAPPRALPALLDQRGLRRPGDPPAGRGLLGQRQPDRPARRLRRGQALRRGADDGLSPPAGRRHGDRADLQHLRGADAAPRRPRHPHLPAPGALRPADHGVRRRLADAQLLLRRRPHRGHHRAGRVRRARPGQHRQPRRVHAAAAGRGGHRGDRLELGDRLRGAARWTTRRCASPTSRARASCSGWEPKVSLHDGLRRTIDQAGVDMLVGAGR